MSEPFAQRRVDLDWLRIAAFAVLIVYHLGMFYVTWGWHVKSADAGPAIEPLMQLVNPWRLGLLFLISGAATRLMAERTTPGAMAAQRLSRLGWPLVFAVLVIVPPQTYVEVVQTFAYGDGPIAFYGRYLTASGDWCGANGCLVTPTWNHMWFVAYLLIYTLILTPVWALAKRFRTGRLPGWAFLILPALYLWACRATLAPLFPSTHALMDDWYNHAAFFGLFALGFGFARWDRAIDAATAARWPALGLALVAFAALRVTDGWRLEEGDAGLLLRRGLHAAQAWGAIVAALGFARRHLSGRDGPLRRTLTEAIFPAYLVHQTLIILAAVAIDPLDWPIGLEAGAIAALTLAGCAGTYFLAKRLGPIRVALGLKP